jgi:hypothetical protein
MKNRESTEVTSQLTSQREKRVMNDNHISCEKILDAKQRERSEEKTETA